MKDHSVDEIVNRNSVWRKNFHICVVITDKSVQVTSLPESLKSQMILCIYECFSKVLVVQISFVIPVDVQATGCCENPLCSDDRSTAPDVILVRVVKVEIN